MSVFFLATQLGVPRCQQQLELGSLLMTFSELLIGVRTPFLDVFIIVQSMIPPLGSQCYPLVGLTHELLARLHLLEGLELQTTPLICETEPSEI